MNHEPRNEAEFLAAARAELLCGCESLDDATRARLRGIRREALERAPVRRLRVLAPFGGLVTACVLVLAVIMLNPTAERAPAPDAAEPVMAVEDLEMLSSGELELYEDFEFYQWLAENSATI